MRPARPRAAVRIRRGEGLRPWRRDPRPAGGLLQGIYAHVGIVRFWASQRHAETEPERRSCALKRSSPGGGRAVEAALDTLRQTVCLTSEGKRFTELMRAAGGQRRPAGPDEALQIAREVSLDHWLTWRIRHVAVDPLARRAWPTRIARAAVPRASLPATWTPEDVRKLGSSVRSRLLNMRYLEPARYRELLRRPDPRARQSPTACCSAGRARPRCADTGT